MWLETSMPGVFFAGNVRLGFVKQVASTAGEGAITLLPTHEYLNAPVSFQEKHISLVRMLRKPLNYSRLLYKFPD